MTAILWWRPSLGDSWLSFISWWPPTVKPCYLYIAHSAQRLVMLPYPFVDLLSRTPRTIDGKTHPFTDGMAATFWSGYVVKVPRAATLCCPRLKRFGRWEGSICKSLREIPLRLIYLVLMPLPFEMHVPPPGHLPYTTPGGLCRWLFDPHGISGYVAVGDPQCLYVTVCCSWLRNNLRMAKQQSSVEPAYSSNPWSQVTSLIPYVLSGATRLPSNSPLEIMIIQMLSVCCVYLNTSEWLRASLTHILVLCDVSSSFETSVLSCFPYSHSPEMARVKIL